MYMLYCDCRALMICKIRKQDKTNLRPFFAPAVPESYASGIIFLKNFFLCHFKDCVHYSSSKQSRIIYVLLVGFLVLFQNLQNTHIKPQIYKIPKFNHRQPEYTIMYHKLTARKRSGDFFLYSVKFYFKTNFEKLIHI